MRVPCATRRIDVVQASTAGIEQPDRPADPEVTDDPNRHT